MSVIVHAVDYGNGKSGISWWCPGCQDYHVVPVTGEHGWTWNESIFLPTLSPSILVYSHKSIRDPGLPMDKLLAPDNIYETPLCHSFMVDGQLQFLSDCTHALAGQTVPIPKWRQTDDN